jgi:8-amino-7-oxononanoate synthase
LEIRVQGPIGARTVIDGSEYDYFSGTSYLGLQNHPEVVRAAMDTIRQFGLSTATSRGGYGENPVFDTLNSEINQYFNSQQNLYFASGFLGNSMLAQGLTRHFERMFIDSSSHFSVWDGVKTADKPFHRFDHLSSYDLKCKISEFLKPGERPVVFTDGVFPISGEISPIPEYVTVVDKYDGLICLDDAHAVGVLGANGRGTLDHYDIRSPSCISAATLSKALGGYGGVIADSAEHIREIDQKSKVYGAASPPPLAAVGASAKALQIARIHPELRLELWKKVKLCRDGLRQLGWELEETNVPIICLRTRPGIDLGQLRGKLFNQKIAVAHVKNYSSTPFGGAIRIAIFATHTLEQIERLINAIKIAI